jgi:adenine-specific DNA-methyltransferase
MLQLLEHADNVGRSVAPLTTQKHKAALGQFMLPSSVARFMASLFRASALQTCKLLDAGAPRQ